MQLPVGQVREFGPVFRLSDQFTMLALGNCDLKLLIGTVNQTHYGLARNFQGDKFEVIQLSLRRQNTLRELE